MGEKTLVSPLKSCLALFFQVFRPKRPDFDGIGQSCTYIYKKKLLLVQLILFGQLLAFKGRFKKKALVGFLKSILALFLSFFAQNGLILTEMGNHALINIASPRAADTFGPKKSFKILKIDRVTSV